MKILLLSDVHANVDALHAVWNAESDADRIWCAGDLVDFGPDPVECVEWFQEKEVPVVRGNHDEAVVSAFRNGVEGAPKDWKEENAVRMNASHIAYLESLPTSCVLEADGRRYGMTHAFRDYETITTVEAHEAFSQEVFGEPLSDLIFGHTHKRGYMMLSPEHTWINPGSISYHRKDEHFRGAHYATITDGKIELKSTSFPTDRLVDYVRNTTILPKHRDYMLKQWA